MGVAGAVAVVAATLVAGAFWTRSPRVAPDRPRVDRAAATPVPDRVATLNQRLVSGEVRLPGDDARATLRVVLGALEIPIESQVLVYSRSSRQRDRIDVATPRAIYFSDTTYVGYVPGGDLLEVITHEAARGLAFHTRPPAAGGGEPFAPGGLCVECHGLPNSGGTPGLLFKSQVPLAPGARGYPPEWSVDDTTPVSNRWGGWYVSGLQAPPAHRGNDPLASAAGRRRGGSVPTPASLDGSVDTARYLSPFSDVTALLVLGHQVGVTNLLARLGVEARRVAHDAGDGAASTSLQRLAPLVRAVVDGLLFVGEARLPGPVRGSSGFETVFTAKGPRDGHGRSLRDFDLREGRVFRYPCSYLIYSPAFDDLPDAARDGIYARLWDVLSGREAGPAYAHLAAADRLAIIEILRATKPGLPAYFWRTPTSTP